MKILDGDENSDCTSTRLLFNASEHEDHVPSDDEDSCNSPSLQEMCESVRDFNQKYQTSVEFSPTKFLANIAERNRKYELTIEDTEASEQFKEAGQDSKVGEESLDREIELVSHSGKILQEAGVPESSSCSVSELKESFGSLSETATKSLTGHCTEAGSLVCVPESDFQDSNPDIRFISSVEDLCETQNDEAKEPQHTEAERSSIPIALENSQPLPMEYNGPPNTNSYLSESPSWFINSPHSLGPNLGPSPMVASQYPAIVSEPLAVHNVPYCVLFVPAYMFHPSLSLTTELTEVEEFESHAEVHG